MIKNGYRELQGCLGNRLEDVVTKLIKHNENGEKFWISFNGHDLYSDKVTMDSAYLQVMDKTKADHDKQMEEMYKRYDEEKKAHEDSIPTQTEERRKAARGIIREDKLDYWDKIVPIRLGDLYRGMELECTIEIGKFLNEEQYVEAKELMESQGHSGMSWGLVKRMVNEFCNNGEKFVESLE